MITTVSELANRTLLARRIIVTTKMSDWRIPFTDIASSQAVVADGLGFIALFLPSLAGQTTCPIPRVLNPGTRF